MQFTTQPLKEPRGFIRLLQVVFAILAFSTTSDYKNIAGVEIKCTETGKQEFTKAVALYTIEYPFTVNPNLQFKMGSKTNPCPLKSEAAQISVAGNEKIDKSTTAEFYVTTGVLAFLYSLVAALVYISLDNLYLNAPILPFFDLVATGVLTLFWFLGWCSWVAQWANVKEFYYDLPGLVCGELSFTHAEGQPVYTVECDNVGDVRFAKITISLIFGFANIILWAGSTWFVFKETGFHKKTEMQASYISPSGANHREQPPQA